MMIASYTDDGDRQHDYDEDDEDVVEPLKQVDRREGDGEPWLPCHHITVVDTPINNVALVRVLWHGFPLLNVVPQVGRVKHDQLLHDLLLIHVLSLGVDLGDGGVDVTGVWGILLLQFPQTDNGRQLVPCERQQLLHLGPQVLLAPSHIVEVHLVPVLLLVVEDHHLCRVRPILELDHIAALVVASFLVELARPGLVLRIVVGPGLLQVEPLQLSWHLSCQVLLSGLKPDELFLTR